jgi:hypothetical protein
MTQAIYDLDDNDDDDEDEEIDEDEDDEDALEAALLKGGKAAQREYCSASLQEITPQ